MRLSLLTCFLFLAASLSAQYNVDAYSPANGLVDAKVSFLYQDSLGRMFFLTRDGFSIYDGKQMRNFTSVAGTPITLITGVLELRRNHFLLLSSGHLAYVWKDGQLEIDSTTFRACHELRGAFRTGSASWLIETIRGFFRFSEGKLVFITGHEPFRQEERGYVEALGVVGDRLYLQQKGPRGTAFTAFNWKNLHVEQVLNLPFGAQGYRPDPKGLALVRDEQFYRIPFSGGRMGAPEAIVLPRAWQGGNRPKPIYFLEGKAWYQLRSNLLAELDPETGDVRSYPLNQSAELSYYYVFRDPEENTWLLAFGLGAVKLEAVSFRKAGGLPSSSSLLRDEEGLLLMSSDRMVWRRSGAAMMKLADLPAEARPFLFRLGKDSWYATPGSFRSLNGREIPLPAGLRSDNPYLFSERAGTDPAGNAFLTGLYFIRLDPQGAISYLKLPYFADMAVCTEPDTYWVFCRSDDLVKIRYRDGALTVTERQRMPGLAARCVQQVGKDRVWVGTRMSGLVELRYDGKWKEQARYGVSRGLSNNFVTFIGRISERQYLLSTASGLDLLQCREGDTLVERISAPANQFSQMMETVVAGDTVYARSIEGEVFSWTPPQRRSTGYQPSFYLDHLAANGISLGKESSLGYRQNNLRFEVAAPSFIRNREVQFLFALRSGERTWQQKSASPVFEINNLEPGDYTLSVTASFPARIYPDKHLDYSFTIRQPFWQTIPFRVLLVLLLTAVIVLLVRSVYVRKLRQQRLVLERRQVIEKERTRIATDMHDDLGAGLSRIKFLSEKLQLQNRTLPISADLNKISAFSDEMSEKMGEIVWALNQRYDSAGDLVSFTRAYASEFLEDKKIVLRFASEVPVDRPLNGEVRRNLFLVIKEALNNIAKHAEATEVTIRFSIGRSLRLEIADNGRGFDAGSVRPFANGLENMRRRVEEIGGRFEVDGRKGTRLTIRLDRLPG